MQFIVLIVQKRHFTTGHFDLLKVIQEVLLKSGDFYKTSQKIL